jgi:hypothetical protein
MAHVPPTSSVIPVPRCTTLTDSLHRLRGQELQVPSNPELWEALVAAIPNTPGAQDPPLYALQDSITGDTFTANEQFVRDFIESWEEEKTHIITVAVGNTLRTFRGGARFWEFARLWSQQVAMLGSRASAAYFAKQQQQMHSHNGTMAESGPYVPAHLAHAETHIVSSQNPRDKISMTLTAWSNLVTQWNRRSEVKGTAGGKAVATALRGVDHASPQDVLKLVQNDDDEDDPLPPPARPRASAVVDPLTTLDDVDMQALHRRFERRDRSSHYWTHFMAHWHVLQAQYRNYL